MNGIDFLRMYLVMDKITKQKISFSVDERIIPMANSVFKELGLTLAEGINIYLYQVFYTQSIPFPIELPEEEMMQRFDLLQKILIREKDIKAG